MAFCDRAGDDNCSNDSVALEHLRSLVPLISTQILPTSRMDSIAFLKAVNVDVIPSLRAPICIPCKTAIPLVKDSVLGHWRRSHSIPVAKYLNV